MKKTKKMLSFVLSMLLIVTMFPTMAFAKEEAKTWKFGELSLKAGDVLGKDTEIKNDAENREIRILSEKTNPEEKKDDKERIKTEKEAVIAAAASCAPMGTISNTLPELRPVAKAAASSGLSSIKSQ